MPACPAQKELRALLNMTPAQIRAWGRQRQACKPKKRVTGRTAVSELEMLARALSSPINTLEDCQKARDAIAFVKRHEAGRKRDKNPCGQNRIIALRDWGYHPPECKIPSNICKRGESHARIK